MSLLRDEYTRTERTLKAYRRDAQYLIARMEREHGISFEDRPYEVIDALARFMADKKKKTILNYRNAVFRFLEEIGHPAAGYAREKLWAVTASPEAKKKSLRRDVREVPRWWLDALLRITRRRLRCERSWLVYALIRAGILTGLRPSEWQSAKLVRVGRATHLVVKNGKFSNGRSFGPYRTLILDTGAIDRSDRELLSWLIETANRYSDEAWREEIRLASTYLRELRQRFPDSIGKLPVSIYSGRHQFAADAKRAGLSLPEIAALMGHRNLMTATRHYGLRRRGDEERAARLAVRPSPDDVDRVILLQRTSSIVEKFPSWLKPQ